ncbi:MAG: NAD(P)/FAD-dependent oxidoreductase [Planctomycetes bacterium]|nr:NAD(P)/FAD-dependent oxidoreductase [Planctomycetota bacterium]
MAFFEGLGVKLKTEEAGKVFPVSDRAGTVVDAFTRELGRLKVAINLSERVTELDRSADGWSVTSDKKDYQAGCVILAAGGRSYPQLGTTGDGFELARRLGHRIVKTRPGLVPLELADDELRELQGVKAEAEMTLAVKGKIVARKSGEMLFTHYGISGPLVLDLSRLILDCAGKPGNMVTVNFFPDYDSPGSGLRCRPAGQAVWLIPVPVPLS